MLFSGLAAQKDFGNSCHTCVGGWWLIQAKLEIHGVCAPVGDLKDWNVVKCANIIYKCHHPLAFQTNNHSLIWDRHIRNIFELFWTPCACWHLQSPVFTDIIILQLFFRSPGHMVVSKTRHDFQEVVECIGEARRSDDQLHLISKQLIQALFRGPSVAQEPRSKSSGWWLKNHKNNQHIFVIIPGWNIKWLCFKPPISLVTF